MSASKFTRLIAVGDVVLKFRQRVTCYIDEPIAISAEPLLPEGAVSSMAVVGSTLLIGLQPSVAMATIAVGQAQAVQIDSVGVADPQVTLEVAPDQPDPALVVAPDTPELALPVTPSSSATPAASVDAAGATQPDVPVPATATAAPQAPSTAPLQADPAATAVNETTTGVVTPVAETTAGEPTAEPGPSVSDGVPTPGNAIQTFDPPTTPVTVVTKASVATTGVASTVVDHERRKIPGDARRVIKVAARYGKYTKFIRPIEPVAVGLDEYVRSGSASRIIKKTAVVTASSAGASVGVTAALCPETAGIGCAVGAAIAGFGAGEAASATYDLPSSRAEGSAQQLLRDGCLADALGLPASESCSAPSIPTNDARWRP
jgi:hypothetical protein